MSARVRLNRMGTIDEDQIKIGAAVREPHLYDAATQANWLHGRCSQRVPMYYPGVQLPVGTTRTFRYRCRPYYQAIQLRWVILARSADASGRPSTIDVAAPSGAGARVYVATAGIDLIEPIEHVQTLSTQVSSTSPLEVTLDLKANDYAIDVLGIGCVEVPRPELALNASEAGVDLATLRTRQPLFDGAAGKSIDALAAAIANARLHAHRGTLFAWGVPESDAFTTTSGAYVAVSDVDFPILAMPKYRSGGVLELTGLTIPEVRVSTSVAGTTGNVRLTRSKTGTTLVIPVPDGAAYAWQTNGTMAFDADDLATDDGLQGGTFDRVKIEVQRTAGAGSVRLMGAVIYPDTAT